MSVKKFLNKEANYFTARYSPERIFKILWNEYNESFLKMAPEEIKKFSQLLMNLYKQTGYDKFEFFSFLLELSYLETKNLHEFNTLATKVYKKTKNSRVPPEILLPLYFKILLNKIKLKHTTEFDELLSRMKRIEYRFYGHKGLESIILKIRAATFGILKKECEKIIKNGENLISKYSFKPSLLVQFYFAAGDYYRISGDEKAIPYLAKAITYAKKGNLFEWISAPLSLMSHIFLIKGDLEKALLFIDLGIKQLKLARPPLWKRNLVANYQTKAVILRRMDRLREALNLVNAALKIETREDILPYLYHIKGNIYFDIEKFKIAIRYFEKALKYKSFFKESEIFNLYHSLTYAYILGNDKRNAEKYLKFLQSLVDKPKKSLYRFLEGLFYYTFGEKLKAINIFEEIVKENKEIKNLFEVDFIFESTLLLANHYLEENKKWELNDIFKKLEIFSRSYHISLGLINEYKNIKIRYYMKKKDIKEAINVLNPHAYRFNNKNGIFVCYFFDKNNIYIWTNKTSNKVIKIEFNNIATLIKQKYFSGTLYHKNNLKKLYKILWKPLLPIIKNESHVLINPSDVLYAVPFHLLNDGKKYVFEDFKIAFTSGLLPKRITYAKKFDSLLGFGLTKFPDKELNFVESELRSISKFFSRSKYFINDDAKMNNILSLSKFYSIIHFATHHYSPHDTELNNVLYAIGNKKYVAPLEGKHIKNMNLLKRPLVVLSSCYSGWASEYMCKEALDIIRSFIKAGAIGVIINQYLSYDKYTMKFMEIFYQNLAHTGDVLLSLQKTYYSMCYTYEIDDPTLWGGFVYFVS